MNLVVTAKVIKVVTYTVEEELNISPPEIDVTRGVYYRQDCDERAWDISGKIRDEQAKMIRQKAKADKAEIAYSMERRGDRLFVIASYTERSGG